MTDPLREEAYDITMDIRYCCGDDAECTDIVYAALLKAREDALEEAAKEIKTDNHGTGLVVNYDQMADVLYISSGPPRLAEGADNPNGVVLRYSTDDDMPCGVTAIGFKAYKWHERISEFVAIVSRHLSVTPNAVEAAIKHTLH